MAASGAICSAVLLLHLLLLLLCSAEETPPPPTPTKPHQRCRWSLSSCQDSCGRERSAALVLVAAQATTCPECVCTDGGGSGGSFTDEAATTTTMAQPTTTTTTITKAGQDAAAELNLLSQLASQLRSILGALSERLMVDSTPLPPPTPTPPPPTPPCRWLRGCGLDCPAFGYRRVDADGCPLCQCRAGPDEACSCRCSGVADGGGSEVSCGCECARMEDGQRLVLRETSRQRVGG